MLDRNIVGEAIFQRAIVQPPIDRAAISSALGWAESHFKIRRVMARALLRETVDRGFTILSTHLSKQISRACWPDLSGLARQCRRPCGGTGHADALIAVGDSMFATIK